MTTLNEKIALLDNVLLSIGQPLVLDNPIFLIDRMSDGNFTRVLINKDGAVSIIFDFSDDGVDIHVDGSSEVFSWGYSFINENVSKVYELVRLLLISSVEIKTYGGKIKIIKFKNSISGEIEFSVKVFDGIFINPFRQKNRNYLAVINI